MQQNCTTSEIKYTLQNKHNTEAFQTFGCIMSILSLSLTAITETEVVDCFMQVRFEVLPVVTMKTPSSACDAMLSHRSALTFQRHLLLCSSWGYTMRAASSCETLVHFYWTTWHYMPYNPQSATHYLLKNQGISCVNPTMRGIKTVIIIETG